MQWKTICPSTVYNTILCRPVVQYFVNSNHILNTILFSDLTNERSLPMSLNTRALVLPYKKKRVWFFQMFSMACFHWRSHNIPLIQEKHNRAENIVTRLSYVDNVVPSDDLIWTYRLSPLLPQPKLKHQRDQYYYIPERGVIRHVRFSGELTLPEISSHTNRDIFSPTCTDSV